MQGRPIAAVTFSLSCLCTSDSLSAFESNTDMGAIPVTAVPESGNSSQDPSKYSLYSCRIVLEKYFYTTERALT